MAISKQVSKLQKRLQPLWLAEITHKKRAENTTRHAYYFNCPGVSNAKHDNLNAYSKFLLQSRLLCALKRRKDNPINCSLQIKALFCRFPPKSGPALLMTCPPTCALPKVAPGELPHTFRCPNAGQWAAPKRLPFRLAVGLHEDATWKNSCRLFS